MSAIFSIRSALVAALILPPAGYAQLRTSGIVTARPLGPAPANLTAGPAASGGARLVWQPVSGAVYRVYRSTDPTVQGAELLGSPVTVLEFLDGTALPGATFYYRVAADYADGRLGTAGPVAFTAATPGAGTLTLSNPGTCGTATT